MQRWIRKNRLLAAAAICVLAFAVDRSLAVDGSRTDSQNPLESTTQKVQDGAPSVASKVTDTATLVIRRSEPGRWRGKKISLSLKNADLKEVLRSFAKLADVNLVIDPAVNGQVTVELHDVPWDQALAVILKSQNVAAELDGRIWRVSDR